MERAFGNWVIMEWWNNMILRDELWKKHFYMSERKKTEMIFLCDFGYFLSYHAIFKTNPRNKQITL